MSNEFKEELNKMETGSVALVFSDPSSDLTVEVKPYLIYLSFRTFDILMALIIPCPTPLLFNDLQGGRVEGENLY